MPDWKKAAILPTRLFNGARGESPRSVAADPAMDGRVDAFNALALIHQELTNGVLKLEAARKQPICIEGCGKCCELNTPMASGLEAQYAYRTWAANSDVRALATAWLTEPDEHLTVFPEATPRVLGGPPNVGLSDEQRKQLALEIGYVASQPCPFLAEDKSCSIHAARPLACRAYSLTLTPDAFCQRPLDAVEQTHPGMHSIDRDLGHKLRQASEAVHKGALRHDPMANATGFWPTVLLAIADTESFQKLVNTGRVPLAKLAQTPGGAAGHYPGVITQEDAEAVAVLRSMYSMSTVPAGVRLRTEEEATVLAK